MAFNVVSLSLSVYSGGTQVPEAPATCEKPLAYESGDCSALPSSDVRQRG